MGSCITLTTETPKEPNWMKLWLFVSVIGNEDDNGNLVANY